MTNATYLHAFKKFIAVRGHGVMVRKGVWGNPLVSQAKKLRAILIAWSEIANTEVQYKTISIPKIEGCDQIHAKTCLEPM